MKIESIAKIPGRLALAVLLSAGIAACDSSTGPDDHGHDDAVGLVVLDRATKDTLAAVNAARQVTGGLTVGVGEDRAVEVWFLSEDGDRFQPDGDHHTLGVRVGDDTVAGIHAHGDHLDLEGLKAGTTTVVFSVVHGSHDDYTSPAIPVTVTP